jgi:hypothetical protein
MARPQPSRGYAIEATSGGFTSSPENVNVTGTPPPPPPTPTKVQSTPRLVKSKKGVTGFTVGFNQSLNAGSAQNLGLYHVFQGTKKKRKVVYTKPLNLRSVTYNSSTDTVTINLKKPYKGIVEVAVQGAIEAVDGNFTTINYAAIIS